METLSLKPLKLVTGQNCAPGKPCPKCSLLMIARYRFGAFRAKFGREPKPNEPLFFDPAKCLPAKASPSQAHAQIESAAVALGIKSAPVMRFLRLDTAQEKSERAGRNPGRTMAKRKRSHVSWEQPPRSNRVGVWERFVKDERLHRLHKVSSEELKTLSRLAMMGEVNNSRDFLYILSLIREAGL